MTMKIKPDARPIQDYLATLQTYADHGAVHEGATETAFSNLLAATARPHGWTLIPKKKKTVGKKVNIDPDGTLQDVFQLARGYWEAKSNFHLGSASHLAPKEPSVLARPGRAG